MGDVLQVRYILSWFEQHAVDSFQQTSRFLKMTLTGFAAFAKDVQLPGDESCA